MGIPSFAASGPKTWAALAATGVILLSTPSDGARDRPVADGTPLSATCFPGPVTLGDLSTGGDGVERFAWPGASEFHEFYFVRAMYHDGGRGGFGFGRRGFELGDGGPAWSTDYANADRHMVLVTKRLSNIDACEWEHPISLADPDLRHFPFLYSLEWGQAALTEEEVIGLRSYLEAGGLLMLDDFWGTQEWESFRRQMNRVLPGRNIVDIPRDHLLFHVHYTIDGELLQIPNVRNGWEVSQGIPGATTSQRDGYVPHVMGIFDDRNRLMVVINWNTDLGDALEWAESPYYPLRYSTFASELFLNTIMYGMSQ